MEQKVENTTTLDHIPQPILKGGNKTGSKNIFKVALFMMRGHSRKSTKSILPVDDESKSIWRKLVGSMRPMHLQNNQSQPQFLDDHQNKLKKVTTNDKLPEDESEYGSEYPNSPSPGSSRYASAVGLNEMVEEEKEEEIVNKDDGDGDEFIDAKADEFIAQFYQEMRLQRMDIVDHHYNEMSMRSLGL